MTAPEGWLDALPSVAVLREELSSRRHTISELHSAVTALSADLARVEELVGRLRVPEALPYPVEESRKTLLLAVDKCCRAYATWLGRREVTTGVELAEAHLKAAVDALIAAAKGRHE